MVVVDGGLGIVVVVYSRLEKLLFCSLVWIGEVRCDGGEGGGCGSYKVLAEGGREDGKGCWLDLVRLARPVHCPARTAEIIHFSFVRHDFSPVNQATTEPGRRDESKQASMSSAGQPMLNGQRTATPRRNKDET